MLRGWLEAVDATEDDDWDQEYHPKSENDPLFTAAAETQETLLKTTVAVVTVVVTAAAAVSGLHCAAGDCADVAAATILVHVHRTFLRVSSNPVCSVSWKLIKTQWLKLGY